MSLNLTIDETDPTLKAVEGRYSDWKAFCVLKRYLESEGDLLLQQTTTTLYKMLPTEEEKGRAGQPSMFSCLLLDIARQIPYAHPAQIKLVQLVRKLENSNKLTFLVHDYDQGYSFHASMMDLKMTIREWNPWILAFDDPGHGTNLCAFVARLSAKGIIGDISFAIWDMRDAFEEDRGNEYCSENVNIAAMWVLYAGQWLLTEMLHTPWTPAQMKDGENIWKKDLSIQGLLLDLSDGISGWRGSL